MIRFRRGGTSRGTSLLRAGDWRRKRVIVRRGARVVDRDGLENRSRCKPIRGFESHPLRFRTLAATRTAGREPSRFCGTGTARSVASGYSGQVPDSREKLIPARMLIAVLSSE